jgi:hypothetical protein
LLPGIRIQIQLTKAKSSFYLMHKDAAHNNVQISGRESIRQTHQRQPIQSIGSQ